MQKYIYLIISNADEGMHSLTGEQVHLFGLVHIRFKRAKSGVKRWMKLEYGCLDRNYENNGHSKLQS